MFDELDNNDKILYSIGSGHYLWIEIASFMDEDIRDELHNELAPCTNEEFLSAYCKKHADKYGEEFEIDGVPAIEAVRA